MKAWHFLSARLQASDDGLTIREMIDAIPTDAASIFTLLLIFGSAAAVLRLGRSKGGGRTTL
jgi:hypothetical protein